MADLRTDLPADVADEPGDRDAGHTVGPAPARGHPTQPHQGARRGQRVQPGVPGIGDQRRRLDAAADHQFVAGHPLVSGDGHQCRGDAPSDIASFAVPQQLFHALHSGHCGAGPDNQRDTYAREVLGAFESVRVTFGGQSSRRPESDEHHHAGQYVGQVVQRVSQQSHRAGDRSDRQLDEACHGQADCTERNGTVGAAALRHVVDGVVQGKAGGGIPGPGDLMHGLSVPRSTAPNYLAPTVKSTMPTRRVASCRSRSTQRSQRTVAKNLRTSSTNSSGCSRAAKCPPRGIVVQCVMW